MRIIFITFIGLTFFIICENLISNEKKITLYDREGIIEIAQKYIGIPYKAGGSSPNGFDCSGFAMFVYKQAGYQIPRTTFEQYKQLHPIKVPKIGDLVFFRIYGNSVSHVGIYMGNFKFIHSPSSGKTVSIADLRTPYWKKHYIGSRTLFWSDIN